MVSVQGGSGTQRRLSVFDFVSRSISRSKDEELRVDVFLQVALIHTFYRASKT